MKSRDTLIRLKKFQVDEKRRKVMQIEGMIAEFERMAQIYSEDSTRDLGGDWGWVDRGTLAAPLEKIAFNLRPGKVSHIIQLAGNYYILKVEDKRGGVTRPFAEVRDEIEKKLVAEEAQAKQERWLASLRQKAYIKMY